MLYIIMNGAPSDAVPLIVSIEEDCDEWRSGEERGRFLGVRDNRKELGSGSKRKSKFSYTSKKLYRKANQSWTLA